jgi:hypothetical protein
MMAVGDSGQIQIANHTWDHPDIRTLTDTELVNQLDRNNRYLTGLYGVDTKPYFRPPYMGHTAATDRVCVDQGYSVITWWNGSFGDSTQITADQIRQNAKDCREHRHRARQLPRRDHRVRRHRGIDPGPGLDHGDPGGRLQHAQNLKSPTCPDSASLGGPGLAPGISEAPRNGPSRLVGMDPAAVHRGPVPWHRGG